MPNVRRTADFPHVGVDVNYWKTFVQRRLLVPLGDRACLSLYGQQDRRHQLLAEHLTAEHAVRTEGYGRQVDEWRIRPGITENHWLDGIVGCAVAASMLGVALFAQGTVAKKKRSGATVSYL